MKSGCRSSALHSGSCSGVELKDVGLVSFHIKTIRVTPIRGTGPTRSARGLTFRGAGVLCHWGRREQRSGGYIERDCEPLDVVNGDIAHSAFNMSDEGPVQAGFVREVFLRPAAHRPKALQVLSKDLAGGRRLRHCNVGFEDESPWSVLDAFKSAAYKSQLNVTYTHQHE